MFVNEQLLVKCYSFPGVGYSNMDGEQVNFKGGDLMFKNPTYSLGRTNLGLQAED